MKTSFDIDAISVAAQHVAHHAAENGRIITSLKEDELVFFLCFQGENRFHEPYQRCFGLLSEAEKILSGFSQQVSAEIEYFRKATDAVVD